MTEAVVEVFCKKGVLKNFAKFTRKHLCQSPFCYTLIKNYVYICHKLLFFISSVSELCFLCLCNTRIYTLVAVA